MSVDIQDKVQNFFENQVPEMAINIEDNSNVNLTQKVVQTSNVNIFIDTT